MHHHISMRTIVQYYSRGGSLDVLPTAVPFVQLGKCIRTHDTLEQH